MEAAVTTLDDQQIPIACTHCHAQVERTFQSLCDNDVLECPTCGHKMASERAAVIHHVARIRKVTTEMRK
jgi:DNA-directed RNA polymerase subunit RPC12/RpoP